MLRVSKITLSYGAEPVLRGVSLKLEKGQFTSLVGPSGSGKSSLLRVIMGLQKPEAGLTEMGVGPAEVGILFQDDALLPWRTASANVALGLRARGVPKREALREAERWLGRLGIGGLGGRFPSEMSGGQRKRVALAQVLALRPKLLLMDEPFASLDAIVRHRITEDLLQWAERERLTVLLVTHDLEEALALSDTVHLLSQGPNARIRESYHVPLPRPRDLLQARTHPLFGALLKRLWHDLSEEAEGNGKVRLLRSEA